MPLNKRSAGSTLLSAKRPRLPVPPEEPDDSQTDESEISFRALTALSTSTRSSQSTSTRSSGWTTAPIARKGLLRSSDTSTGRSSPRRVECHLPDGNTDSAEVQEQQEDVPEVEETADTSYSEYDGSPENDHESSEENLDDSEEEPQASTQRSQSTGKRPCTVQPTTARALGNARRRPTGVVAEVIASSDVSVHVVQGQNANHSEGNTIGCEDNTETRRRFMESSTHFGTHTECILESAHRISENVHRIPESVDFGTQPGSISESIPGISKSLPGVSESTPDTLTPFYTAHKPFINAFELSSSIQEEENAPIAESEAQRIEKECSTLIGDHTLLHEPFPPAARLSVLEVSMWAAASRRVGCTVDLDEVVIKQVKGRLADSTIYGLGNLSGPEARAVQAEYLLKNDRFLSPVQHYETYRLWFLEPEIIDILYYKYFDKVRMRGVKDPEFLERITPTFICLISTVIWYGIRAWSTGAYVKPDHFQSQNESVVKMFNRICNTWKRRSTHNQEATLEVIKDNLWEKIREKKRITIEVIPEDGFSEDDEALAADLAAFRNARKAPPSTPVDSSSSDNGGGQEEVVHAQLRALKWKRKAKKMKRTKKRGITKEARRKRMSRAPASAVESTAERFGGECFGEHRERFGGIVLYLYLCLGIVLYLYLCLGILYLCLGIMLYLCLSRLLSRLRIDRSWLLSRLQSMLQSMLRIDTQAGSEACSESEVHAGTLIVHALVLMVHALALMVALRCS
ncbi:hypothetical protein DFP73DRAFT_524658 [Morchella snyderi]|nr:hypothetical protein DFP73DRAFT_524658 [Morchella snyderi]